MPNTYMLSLGNFEFSLKTAPFDQLRRSTTYSWPKQDRIRQWAGRQWTGPSDESISLDGTIITADDTFGKAPGAFQMDTIRSMAEMGVPYELFDGGGHQYGLWVIESVEDTGSIFVEEGRPRKQTFAISLGKYVKDNMMQIQAVVSDLGAGIFTDPTNLRDVNTGIAGNTSTVVLA